MALAPGTRLGPYEILALLGSGGMGEVYRARDHRLARDIAIKVLTPAVSADPERLQRFEQEARATAALNHPNILAVHDIGSDDGTLYIVSELLEGTTLRDSLTRGALPVRKAIDYGVQIASGLAAAHEKGVVHRDLKPENLFITTDGHVKILDFGLAKLVEAAALGGAASGVTRLADTTPGIVLGTVGYMSPEQVRGEIVDHRSDIFSVGAVLYEMLAGTRAFSGETPIDAMHAILSEDPPDLPAAIPPALDHLVRHCLERTPRARFQSASDVAFALNAVALSGGQPAGDPPIARRSARALAIAVAACSAVALAAVGAFIVGRRGAAIAPPPSFRQLTFRHGTILSARFAPDGATIVYGGAWDGAPFRLFTERLESLQPRALETTDADVLAISSSGELALSLGRRFAVGLMTSGTLATAPLDGGAPHELLENVLEADWSPTGSELAVARNAGGKYNLEYPVGKVLYETSGWISHPHVSRDGALVAFLDHPVRGDDRGAVAFVDRSGKVSRVSSGWLSCWGLAWSPGGDEIWFTAATQGWASALYGVTLGGRQRLIARAAGRLALQDVSASGRILVTRDSWRIATNVVPEGAAGQRDLSWFDGTVATDLTDDGTELLEVEAGEGGGPLYTTYLRKTDGSPAARVGEGWGVALSPDRRWVLASLPTTPSAMVLRPTGAGIPKMLPRGTIGDFSPAGSFFHDGKRLLLAGSEPGHGSRLYVQAIDGGDPRPISEEGVDLSWPSGHLISRDETTVVAIGPDAVPRFYPVGGGRGAAIRGLSAGDWPIRFSADERSIYVYRTTELPARVYRVDIATGQRTLWKEFMPADPAGVMSVMFVQLTPDARASVYTYFRVLSDLYLVEGLK